MTIARRILLFQLVVIVTIAAIGAVVLLHLRSTSYYLERTHWAQRQLDETTRLAVVANRYSEQIAELLLIGEPERDDFEDARRQLNDVLREIRDSTTQEAAFLRVHGDEEEADRDPDRVAAMRALLREIDRAVERLLLLNEEGRKAEAVQLFRSDIENRLDAELERLITNSVAEERAELADAEAQSKLSARRLTFTILAVSALLLALTIGAGMAFSRSLVPSLQALAAGAAAIGRGDLDYRIDASGHDELAVVSQRFNRMAEELKAQRNLLLDAKGELETQVAARTAELTEANRRLTELDRERVRLLADVSHEIRTPLTVLRGEAEVTLRGPSKPESVYREALESIAAQAADMGRLVDDLLFIARSEAEEIRFDYRAVDVGDLVAAAAEETKVLADQKQIEFVLHSRAPGPNVKADPRRLKQAVLIVLDNAIKYSPPNSRVDVAVAKDTETAVNIRIRDRGPGITPEDMPHVFDRFFRGENARDQHGGGSGLGLAIARWIVEQHGGDIKLASDPGQGTLAQITLPAAA